MVDAGARDPAWLLPVLRRHGLIPDAPGWHVALAPGGSTDRTFRVSGPDGDLPLTVRLARPGLHRWLRHEADVLRELAAVDGACTPREIALIADPELPEGEMIVHDHLRGEPAVLRDLTSTAREHLGACLEVVHRAVRPGYMVWPSLDVRQGSRADAYRARVEVLTRFRAAREGLAEIDERVAALRAADLPAAAGWDEPLFSLLHGDLSSGNIIWDGDRPTLIDWEFARDGDPAEDLAYLTSEARLEPEQLADVAEGYVASGGEAWAFARLPVWLPLVRLDAALWWADYWLGRGIDPLTTAEVRARLGAGE
ncbi:MAG: aminoglycoside phosphotransferase family protein [Thermomicrobiales bacterium]|nr:aminoglycoside phosphotransferase family protein [Thermomicrobiales bacterium]